MESEYKSNHTEYKSYGLHPVIVKANDDLRQEVLAMQLMRRMQEIFDKIGLRIRVRPYEVIVTESDAGFIEFLKDTISIDQLKKKFLDKSWNLRHFYEHYFGEENFLEAQKNFIESLAGYCIYNYIFNVKDRHNGNILIDA